MATKIFLGEPPANIKQWIIDHATPPGPVERTTTKFYIKDGDPEEYDIVGEFGMQQMDQYGFDGSRFFTKLELGTHVTSLGDEVFSERAPWMTSITLPSTLSSIGMWAFEMCHRISSVTIPSSVQYIGQEAFNATLFNNITFQGKTLAQVQEMENYPWGIEDTSIINVA